MEDTVFSPGTMLGFLPDSPMDFDFMDELFLDGCWLETTDGSIDFLRQSPSSSTALLDPSFVWPPLEANGNLSESPSQKGNSGEMQRPLLPDESQGRSIINSVSLGQNMINAAGCSSQSENYISQGYDLGRSWWISPTANPGSPSSVMDRVIRAIGYIKEIISDKNVLIQIWVPVNMGGRRVLTTNDQPFLLDSTSKNLRKYRDISLNFQFSAEEDSKELVVGMPGRVFLGKVPEWTPDVRFFRSDEYARVDHAQKYDVRGTLALPIFEQGSSSCLGVIEVVRTTQQIKYGPELENVCKALQAFDLRTSEVFTMKNVKAYNRPYQAALPEIQEVLRTACETHKLPLAQTWVPCILQGKGGCRHSDENYAHCVSTVDHACFIADPNMQGFHEACSEHHLLKGQGVVGGAFMTDQPCFSADITSYGKTEYPLSHYARMFGLCAAVALHLRSIHTGTADFVLEFFLPADCRDFEEQKKMLSSLSVIIQQVCQSLRVVTHKELEEETNLPVSEATVISDSIPSTEEMLGEKSSEIWQCQSDSNLKRNAECGEESGLFDEGSFPSVGTGRSGEKRRTKAEKAITLPVLRRYFAGSLKDAANSIGVCPTTLKRICRQHGIKRWPSRKIKKVGHSLQKLQLVIDSVHGAPGAFQINSFYTNFPELASPKLSGTSTISASKPSDHPQPSSMKPEGGILSSQAAASKSPPSSSCSQDSSSSNCFSTGTQQHSSTWNNAGCEDPIVGESFSDGALKRIRSESEEQKLLPRSQSLKSFNEPNPPSLLPVPKDSSRVSQEGDAQKMKVAYGDEKIRLRKQNNWGYKDLLQEIARRFNIADISRFDIKYLDDDSEWVLLTCDDDLEECIDVCRSSQSRTIKLSLQVSRHHLGKSFR